MKLFAVLTCVAVVVAEAFSPSATFVRRWTSLSMGKLDEETTRNLDLSGNAWMPTEGKMQATDVGDFFPDGYVDELAFTDGLKGVSGLSHPKVAWSLPKKQKAASGQIETPGMAFMGEGYLENDVIDHVLAAGIEECDPYTEQCIPEDMEFVAASVPDGNVELSVVFASAGTSHTLEIKPFCMGFEDYFAGFTADSHPSFSVSPNAGRMERRGGEATFMEVTWDPRGQQIQDTYEGVLVVNIPEDGSKLTYTFKANNAG